MPAVKAAQRVPWVRAPKMMSLAAGQSTPKAVMNDLSIPPESPELRAAFSTDAIGPKFTALAARSACPTADI